VAARQVSLAEVARRSGVSVATASRVLNPDSAYPVSEPTRARVLDAASALNYTPNQAARTLRNRRGRTIGVIVHDVRDPYFSHCLRGVTDEASKAGYLTMICNSDRLARVELDYVRTLIEQRVAGIVFIGGEITEPGYRGELARLVARVRAYGGEVVALAPRSDRWLAELPDNRGGAEDATRHLLELGHRRIAFIDGPENLLTSAERRVGYVKALEDAGVPFEPSLVLPGDFSRDAGIAAVRRLLESGPGFTAVFAANDEMAMGALHELRTRGIGVPSEVSIVGFGDLPHVGWLDPPLTTVAVPMWELGAAGTSRLLAAVNRPAGGRRARVARVHPTRLVVRGSTGLVPPSEAGGRSRGE
jgi:LacI family transcriptional regulator